MRCINCGNELPPDTAECPYCLEREKKQGKNRIERRKIFITLGFCALVLGLIAAAVLIFMPKSAFQRELDIAESSYSVASLCESYPDESGDLRYQLRLLDAIEDIEERYNSLSSGYNQTVTALRQFCGVDNPVVCDRASAVWANVERMRLYQLINHDRTENGLPKLTWEPNSAAAAESVADEFSISGMAYQENAERLVRTMLPDAEKANLSSVLRIINAQDALNRLSKNETEGGGVLTQTDYTQIGIGAAYDTASARWNFFILMLP